jgi:addiction module HigA family antidote
MLLEEFIRPLGMTQAELADRIGVSYVRLNEIVNGRRGITPSTALRLAKARGTTAQFWLNGQLAAPDEIRHPSPSVGGPGPEAGGLAATAGPSTPAGPGRRPAAAAGPACRPGSAREA